MKLIVGDFFRSCGAKSCMTPLSANLFIIYVTMLTATNAVESVSPYIVYFMNACSSTNSKVSGSPSSFADIEDQIMRNDYDPIGDGIQDFASIAIEFGFMTLFIPALPVASFFSLMYNFTQIRIDGSKLLHGSKRPFPMQDNDIGSWEDIFLLISTIAIFTNGALVFFTMDLPKVQDWLGKNKVWFYFFYCIGLLVFRRLLEKFFTEQVTISSVVFYSTYCNNYIKTT